MDYITLVGGIMMLGIGLIGRFRPNLLWRIYSLDSRWRDRNPEQPDDWDKQAHKQGFYMIAFGLFFLVLAFVMG